MHIYIIIHFLGIGNATYVTDQRPNYTLLDLEGGTGTDTCLSKT